MNVFWSDLSASTTPFEKCFIRIRPLVDVYFAPKECLSIFGMAFLQTKRLADSFVRAAGAAPWELLKILLDMQSLTCITSQISPR